ncbi:FkbM family methyltransferase [Asticcacaulis sp.]|uniref:FkbM family methyltransferase n=1 Tax=Asticcacaulis sp. TaxID=1872648 RepID=UPI0026231626|nr:FkbM family methyltransferase [Asticcacaulis sp.]
MLISFEQLKSVLPELEFGGMRVLHVGACKLEELPLYQKAGISDIVWIEARKDEVQEMRRRHPDQKILCACVSNVTGQPVTFETHKNVMCSSALRITDLKRRVYKATVVKAEPMTTITLTDLLARYKIERPFQMLNVDIQGSELAALQGFPEKLWPEVQIVYVELNRQALYAGSFTEAEMDAFMATKGLYRACERWCHLFGDAAYVRGRAPGQPSHVFPPA